MFRARARRLRVRTRFDRGDTSVLLVRDDSGSESGSEVESDVESDVEKKTKTKKIAPGRPTELPPPPGRLPPVQTIFSTDKPETPTSTTFSTLTVQSTTTTTSISPPPPSSLPSSPGLIPIQNPTPGTPVPPLTTLEPETSTTSSFPAPTTTGLSSSSNVAPLPITFPTTFPTPSTSSPSSLTTTSSSSTTLTVPLTNSPAPAPVPDSAPPPASGPAAQIDTPKATLKPGAKAGIAMGTMAAVAMLGAFFFFLWRRQHLRRARGSLIFDGPTSAPRSVEPGAGPPLIRTDSQILNDLLSSAYAHQNGETLPLPLPASGPGSGAGANFTNEKAGQVVAVLNRFPSAASNPEREVGNGGMDDIPNATIRASIASWLRRHHPLQLNPLGGLAGRASVGGRGSKEVGEERASGGGLFGFAGGLGLGILGPRSRPVSASISDCGPRSPGVRASGATGVTGVGEEERAGRTSLSPPPATAPIPAQPVPLPLAHQQQQPKEQEQKGRFVSVWSDTSYTSSVPSTDGMGSVLGYYGQAMGDSREVREEGEMDGVRTCSPTLGEGRGAGAELSWKGV